MKFEMFTIIFIEIDYPQPRKFHSIIPFRDNEILMFGGAYFDVQTHDHVPVDEHVWSFNFTTLQWSLVSSLNLIRPVYFQAAALNQVLFSLNFLFDLSVVFFHL